LIARLFCSSLVPTQVSSTTSGIDELKAVNCVIFITSSPNNALAAFQCTSCNAANVNARNGAEVVFGDDCAGLCPSSSGLYPSLAYFQCSPLLAVYFLMGKFVAQFTSLNNFIGIVFAVWAIPIIFRNAFQWRI
jgi:hypothetical protein